MRYKQFRKSSKKHFAFYSVRKPEKRLELLISTIRSEKKRLVESKARLESLRYGNLRISAKRIPGVLSDIARTRETLHWLRIELTLMWFSAHPECREAWERSGGVVPSVDI